ncbi:hypothetical protein [Sinorhizobium meliloti]|jgi:hypothetical protein|uniref:hypothetical protein n=1 Tax=Rhizobium meliloti TaxID=382 RepID=UPI003F18644C
MITGLSAPAALVSVFCKREIFADAAAEQVHNSHRAGIRPPWPEFACKRREREANPYARSWKSLELGEPAQGRRDLFSCVAFQIRSRKGTVAAKAMLKLLGARTAPDIIAPFVPRRFFVLSSKGEFKPAYLMPAEADQGTLSKGV